MENGPKKYTVIVQDPATEMLLSHVQFLAQVSEDAADRLIAEFYGQAKSLEFMPERCSWLDGDMVPYQKYRKLLLGKRYLFIFVIEGDNVYIDAMVDCRQDYAWLL
jgi:plasmid stabilization system protein ParE